jgi:hypothetical protein
MTGRHKFLKDDEMRPARGPLTLTELACYLNIGILAAGAISLTVTITTGSEIAYRLVQATLAPLPLWAFIIIIAAMADGACNESPG